MSERGPEIELWAEIGTQTDRIAFLRRYWPDLVDRIERAAAPPTPEPGIDVERLARARHATGSDCIEGVRWQDCGAVRHLIEAEQTAAEYDRLASKVSGVSERRLVCERNESSTSAHGHDDSCYSKAAAPSTPEPASREGADVSEQLRVLRLTGEQKHRADPVEVGWMQWRCRECGAELIKVNSFDRDDHWRHWYPRKQRGG